MAASFLLSLVISVLLSIKGTQCNCRTGTMGYDGSCYILLPVKSSWAEAQHYCEALQGDLAVISSKEEEQFVDGFLSRLHDAIKTDHVWLGATDLIQEGSFVAAKTLEPLTYFNWAPGEPDNVGTGQHCVSMFRDLHFKWDDNNCEVHSFPLCKMPELENVNGIIG